MWRSLHPDAQEASPPPAPSRRRWCEVPARTWMKTHQTVALQTGYGMVRSLRAAEQYSNKLNGLDPSQESQETSEEEEPFADAMEIPEMLPSEPYALGVWLQRNVLPKLETAVETFSSFGLVQRGFYAGCRVRSRDLRPHFMEMVFKALSTLSMRKVPKGLTAGAEEEPLLSFAERLKNLENRWPFPVELGTYKAIRQRREAESPFFRRLQLEPLLQLHNACSDGEVTPQFRSNYIYAGAVLSPDAGDRTERAKQLQPMVARHMLRPAEVQTSINRISSTNSLELKEIRGFRVMAPLSVLEQRKRSGCGELDEHLMEPLSRRLEALLLVTLSLAGALLAMWTHASDS
ncbi:unnamed protein product, partial [Symbiodinium necroappetens]